MYGWLNEYRRVKNSAGTAALHLVFHLALSLATRYVEPVRIPSQPILRPRRSSHPSFLPPSMNAQSPHHLRQHRRELAHFRSRLRVKFLIEPRFENKSLLPSRVSSITLSQSKLTSHIERVHLAKRRGGVGRRESAGWQKPVFSRW